MWGTFITQFSAYQPFIRLMKHWSWNSFVTELPTNDNLCFNITTNLYEIHYFINLMNYWLVENLDPVQVPHTINAIYIVGIIVFLFGSIIFCIQNRKCHSITIGIDPLQKICQIVYIRILLHSK